MGAETKIQWCDRTWNPWRGCEHDSPGCDNCYAEAGSLRNPAVLGEWGPEGERAIAAESYWRLPAKWDREAATAGERRRVFSLSYGDWLEDRRGLDPHRARMLAMIAATANLDYLLLTKRPGNFRPLLVRAFNILLRQENDGFEMVAKWLGGEPPKHVWLGTSVEDQQRADERVPDLMALPAALRFVSVEPLLGPVNLQRGIYATPPDARLRGTTLHRGLFGSIDWVIVGGESGPHARPCDLDWIGSIITQCVTADVPVFVKQLGANVQGSDFDSVCAADIFPGDVRRSPGRDDRTCRLHLTDPKGGNPDEWPEGFRLREFPRLTRA